ncbi:MAG: hypothetical protein D3910_28975 [Candidatus Electrothrix sp. ATG2]|nr:hypothetical protein [Candidatus Electrothrix sp. ATG2]
MRYVDMNVLAGSSFVVLAHWAGMIGMMDVLQALWAAFRGCGFSLSGNKKMQSFFSDVQNVE